MVQLRLPHPSGDSKTEDKPKTELIICPGDEVYGGKCGETASVVIVPLMVEERPYQPCEENIEEQKETEEDPWDLPELQDNSPSWHELDVFGKVRRVVVCYVGKPLCLLALLYLFICSLDLLSSAFRLLGGKAVGEVFASSELLQNPVAGLMIGILATVLVQSSSTSTSIVITMVAAGIIPVPIAIPIIMGANIGTSVTNTIVAMTESGDRRMFRLAFAGATVHDMFNWLAVIVLLPLECATGYLYHLTTYLVNAADIQSNKAANRDFLKKLTKPFTKSVIQLDKNIIEKIALGHEEYMDKSLVKRCDTYELHDVNGTELLNETAADSNATYTITPSSDECPWFLLQSVPLSDTWLGLLLLVSSLVILCSCLVLLVKVLKSILRGKIVKIVKKVVNAEFCGAGLISLMLGAVMTMLVQSSSIFTSVLTPLVGLNVIKLESMYPLTLGSNIGTTTTGLLAAMAASGDKLQAALQIALVHLFFNISGILLFYPIPQTRIPIRLAKIMGNTTAKYRWFAAFYLIMMFIALPIVIFSISMAGTIPLAVFLCIVMSVATFAIILNVLQEKIPNRLHPKLRSWDFLPFEWMHSLDPLDRLISRFLRLFKSCGACCGRSRKPEKPERNLDVQEEETKLNDNTKDESQTAFMSFERERNTSTHHLEEDSRQRGSDLAKDLEKKFASEAWDAESGYGSRDVSSFPSRIPTPNNSTMTTPSASLLPSRNCSVLDLKKSSL